MKFSICKNCNNLKHQEYYLKEGRVCAICKIVPVFGATQYVDIEKKVIEMPKNWITTTIEWKYMVQILDGTKKVEYKNAQKEWWINRLFKYIGKHDGDLGINFVVKRKAFKFLVTEIKHEFLPMGEPPMDIAGEKCGVIFEIHLGDRLL